MENKEREIKDLEKKIKDAEKALGRLFVKAGEAASLQKEETLNASAASELLKKIEDLVKSTDSERIRIQDILATVERTDEIDALRSSLTSKIRSIEKDNISNYETIGRASYEAYKSGELPEEKYADIFMEIVKTIVKIDNYESEQQRLTEQEKAAKLVDRLRNKARSLYLKNLISGHYNQLQRQYKRAGEKICHSELVMNLEAESVENALGSFRANMAGIEQLEKEDQALNSETEKLRGNLEGLGVQNGALKTVEKIETHINEMYEEGRRLRAEIGEMVSSNRKDPLAKAAGVKAVLKEIDSEKKVIEDSRKEIIRLESEIEIEQKNQEIEALNKKINGYKEKISNFSAEADQLKSVIQAAEENIKKLEKKPERSGEEQHE